jgi:hypothetical protein
MLPLDWIRQVLVSQFMWLTNWKGGTGQGKGFGDKKFKGSGNNCVMLPSLKPGHIAETGTCPAKENNPLFLIET